jgi:hypothetical protein
MDLLGQHAEIILSNLLDYSQVRVEQRRISGIRGREVLRTAHRCLLPRLAVGQPAL